MKHTSTDERDHVTSCLLQMVGDEDVGRFSVLKYARLY